MEGAAPRCFVFSVFVCFKLAWTSGQDEKQNWQTRKIKIKGEIFKSYISLYNSLFSAKAFLVGILSKLPKWQLRGQPLPSRTVPLPQNLASEPQCESANGWVGRGSSWVRKCNFFKENVIFFKRTDKKSLT